MQIQDRMKETCDRKKSYADVRRKPLEFQVGDMAVLKVYPWKGVMWFVKWGKLNLRYIRPFKTLERIGLVAYQIKLPQELNNVNEVFHMSNLNKFLPYYTLVIPLDEIHINPELNFKEESIEIMDREVKLLKQSEIAIVKVQWNSKRGLEYTWEREGHMKDKYHHLLEGSPTTR